MPTRSSSLFALWLCCLCLCLEPLASCSSTSRSTVSVTIDGIDDTVVSVQIDAQLNGLPLVTKLPALEDPLDSFTVNLAEGDTGQLTLQAQAIGSDGCVNKQGSVTVTISDLGSYTATIELTSQQGCLLTVMKTGDGAGRVMLSDGTVWDFPKPTAQGDACPVAEDSPSFQQQSYTLKTQVTLRASLIPSGNSLVTSYFGGWGSGCTGSGDCNITISPGTTTVRVNFYPTEVCSLSHFCWEQPRPQGANLRQISGRSADDVWAVGEAGIILRWNGTYWLSPNRPQVHKAMNGIWVGEDTAQAAGDIWAVGDVGTVLHRDGQGIWACPTSITDANLNDIWGSASSDIWAVGSQAAIFHWNGSTWSQVAAPSGVTADLKAVAGSDGSDVWVAGSAGTVLHYDGSSWSQVTFPLSDGLSGVWVSGKDPDGKSEIWVVGDNGRTAKIYGTTVTVVDSKVAVPLEAVWGSSPTDIWAAGQQGVLLHYKPATGWSLANPGVSENLMGLWGSGSSSVWAVGTNGSLSRYNGVSWLPLTEELAKHSFNGVWGPAAQPSGTAAPIWGVGDQGQVLRWSGYDWVIDTLVDSKTGMNLEAVWGSSMDDVWMVGGGGVGLHLVNQSSSSMKSTGTTSDLFALWGSAATDVIAVGASGTLTHFDGSAWTAQILPAAAGGTLRAVWGSAANQVWLAGDGGLLMTWNGTTAAKVASSTAASLRALWGSSATDIWAVGDAGTLLHYSSGAWSASSQSGQLTTRTLYSIWGLSAKDIWVAGDLGTLLHYDGTTWSQYDSGFDKSLNGIWANATQGVVTVGRAGAILRYLD